MKFDVLVRFHRLASQELRRAAGNYERAVRGLGYEFRDAVVDAVGVIADHPEIAESVDEIAMPEVRRFVLNRFPYLLVYHVRLGAIEVLAVSHGKRKARYWIRRVHRH